jgi:hypothetical protein
MQIQNTTMNNSSGEQTTWAWRLFHPEPLSPLNQDARSMPNQVADLTDVDPAIVSVIKNATKSGIIFFIKFYTYKFECINSIC